jgi:hypothetical protein
VVESVGKTRRLPVASTVPIALSMETLVTFPVTSQRSIDDCPRWMDVGSAENCATVGAAGGGGAGAGAGGGGGGGGGAFFLQPAANIARDSAIKMSVNFRLLNMNYASRILYFPQTGRSLFPCVVNCCTSVPFESIV